MENCNIGPLWFSLVILSLMEPRLSFFYTGTVGLFTGLFLPKGEIKENSRMGFN